MSEHRLTGELLAAYGKFLLREERSPGTVENYLRHVRAFVQWTGSEPATREAAAGWK